LVLIAPDQGIKYQPKPKHPRVIELSLNMICTLRIFHQLKCVSKEWERSW